MTDKSRRDSVPSHKELLNPVLNAFHSLGESASNNEILTQVIEDLDLPNSVTTLPHGSDSRSELEYRIAWVRTSLKQYGLIENSQTGIWSLTHAGRNTESVDPDLVSRRLQKSSRSTRERSSQERIDLEDQDDDLVDRSSEESAPWREELLDIILNMHHGAFERLCQRILRESGFSEVKVTGKPGDGGIDGEGVLRIKGLISFPVKFQCKRWKNSVGPSVIREFRGAMSSRVERGLILTTSRFSHEARKEAKKDDNRLIELVDGEQLVDMLRELELGVRLVQRQDVEVNKSWWQSEYDA